MTRTLLALALILSLSTGCKKDNSTTPPFSFEDVYNCQQAQNYTTGGLNARLVGSWRLNHYTTPWQPGSVYYQDKEVYLTMTEGKFTVTQDGNDTDNGSWELKHDNNSFEIIPSVSNQYVNGEVYLCNDKLILSTAYVDGPSYYFVKVD